MLAILTSLFAATTLAGTAFAGTTDGLLDHVSNRLEVEMALENEGMLADASGVVFSYAAAATPMKYDSIQGRTRILDREASTVGFAELTQGVKPVSALFRSDTSGRLCTKVAVESSLADQSRLAVYNARGEDLENDNQAQIVFGRDVDGQSAMAVWIRPGEQVTSVSVVNSQSGHKRARTELRRGARTLVLAGDGNEAEACYGVSR